MWDIWANQLLPKALKTCPSLNKSPNLVTLDSLKTSAQSSIPFASKMSAYSQWPIAYITSIGQLSLGNCHLAK